MIEQAQCILKQMPVAVTIREFLGKHFRKVIKNSGWALVATIVCGVLGVLRAIVLGRFLGVNEYGKLALIISYVTILNQFVDFRVWETTTKYLSGYWANKEKDLTVAMVKLSYLVDFSSGVVAFLLIVLGLPIISKFGFFDGIQNGAFVLFGLSLLFATVDNTGLAVLRVFDKFDVLSGWQIGSSFLKLFLVIGVLLLGYDLNGVLIAYSLSAFTSAVVLLYLIRKTLISVIGELRGSISLLKGEYKKLAQFLLHTNMSTFWGAIIKNFDVLLLGYFRGAIEVGYFKMAKTFVSQIARLTAPLYQALFPELSKMWVTEDISTYNGFLKKLTGVVGAIAISGAMFFNLIVSPVVRLSVGEEYSPSVPAMRIMIWGIVVAITFIWARPTVVAIGKPQIGNLAGGIEVVFYLVMSLIIVPKWGYLGTAVMFLVPYVLGHLIVIGGYFRYLRQRKLS
jgi:O-antigen/teichoic acid export membrane protein